jgi:hypothetical protein
MLKRAITAFLLLICLQFSTAQDKVIQDSLNRYFKLDASYIVGSQIYNNNFIYNPGYGFQVSYGIDLSESVGIGLGTGYSAMQDEHFLPIFIEAMGSRKKKTSSPVIMMQLGYAVGWYSGDIPSQGYDFGGGMFIDAGLGRKITIGKEYALYFHWSYRHQFAKMEYEVFGGQAYREGLNYDMIVISLGLIRF